MAWASPHWVCWVNPLVRAPSLTHMAPQLVITATRLSVMATARPSPQLSWSWKGFVNAPSFT